MSRFPASRISAQPPRIAERSFRVGSSFTIHYVGTVYTFGHYLRLKMWTTSLVGLYLLYELLRCVAVVCCLVVRSFWV